MSIEFHCGQCQRLLTVPDGSAGKLATCQSCGAAMTVPAVSAALPGRLQSPHEAWQAGSDPANPYQSPLQYADPSVAGPGDWHYTKVQLEDVLSQLFRVIRQRLGEVYLGTTVVVLVNQVVSYGVGMALGIQPWNPAQIGVPWTMRALWFIAITVFSTWTTTGLAIYYLKLVRGQRASLGDLFAGGPYLWRVLVATLVFMAMMMGGLMFCVVPGIIVTLFFCHYYYPIIDHGAGVIDAFGLSRRITEGNRLVMAALLFIGVVLMLPLMLVGIFMIVLGPAIGTILTVLLTIALFPPLYLIFPVSYLAMTGQPTAELSPTVSPE